METEQKKTGFSTKQTIALVLAAVALTIGLGTVLLWLWLFPGPFTPVRLSQAEESQLDAKLTSLEHGVRRQKSLPAHGPSSPANEQTAPAPEALRPEIYSETGANREIVLTEREINAMIARNTDLADKMVLRFSENLVSLSLRVPLEEDVPFFGGRILRVTAGAELAFRNERPVVILRGVSVMGVPIPGAWLGDLKNMDLVETFGGQPGFWQSFSRGVAAIRVSEGELRLVLQE